MLTGSLNGGCHGVTMEMRVRLTEVARWRSTCGVYTLVEGPVGAWYLATRVFYKRPVIVAAGTG